MSFQARFHWHVETRDPTRLYQAALAATEWQGGAFSPIRSGRILSILTYVDDRDLNKKLTEWEQFYNFSRPHGAFAGKTAYEAHRAKLQ